MDYLELDIKFDEEEPTAAEVFVDGKIGTHDYRFLLDTGAAKTHIIFDEYNADFETVGVKETSGVFKKMQDDLIKIPSIEFGPIAKSNIVIARAAAQFEGMNSLIGMDILKDFRCHFMFDENRVYIDREVDTASNQVSNTLITDSGYHPYIDVQVGSQIAQTVWDSGASLTVVDASFIQKNSSLFERAGSSTGTDASGTSVETTMYVMAESLIGGYSFPKCRVAEVDLSQVNASIEIPMDMILGYNIFSKANWLFDFPRKTWMILNQI